MSRRKKKREDRKRTYHLIFLATNGLSSTAVACHPSFRREGTAVGTHKRKNIANGAASNPTAVLGDCLNFIAWEYSERRGQTGNIGRKHTTRQLANVTLASAIRQSGRGSLEEDAYGERRFVLNIAPPTKATMGRTAKTAIKM